MKRIAMILTVLLLAGTALAEQTLSRDGMRVEVKDRSAVIARNDDSATVHLDGGHIVFASAAGKLEWLFGSTEFMSWSFDFPGPETADRVEVGETADGYTLTVEFPVHYDKRVRYRFAVSEKFAGVAVTCELINQSKGLRYEHCFFGWKDTAKQFATRDDVDGVWRGAAGTNAAYLPAIEGDTDVFGWIVWDGAATGPDAARWLLVAQANFSLCETNAAYIDWNAMLHPSPREQILASEEFMTIAFLIGSVKTEAEAEQRYQQALALELPAAVGITPPMTLEAIDYGDIPAPSWLGLSDKYSKFPYPWDQVRGMTVAERFAQWGNTSFFTHAGNNPEDLEAARRAGMPSLVYYNWMEIPPTDAGDVYRMPYEHAAHPEWTRIKADGKPTKSYFGEHNGVDLDSMCMHHRSLHVQAVKQMRELMNRNQVDGIFIDCAASLPECYGEQYGLHRHAAGKSNRDMYMELLAKVYSTVKTSDGKVVMLNDANSPEEWAFCDTAMNEETVVGADWESLLYKGKLAQDAFKNGKYPTTLAYANLGWDVDKRGMTVSNAPADLARNALFSYAYSRLFDMLWGDLTFVEVPEDGRHLIADFNRANLIHPVSGVKSAGKLYYREFDNGVVLLNSDRRHPAKGRLELQYSGKLTGLADGTTLTSDGGIDVELPPVGAMVLLKDKEVVK